MGPDCTEIFLFFKAAATRGISFLLYQSSDSVTSPGVMSWWAGKSLLRSPLVRGVAVGLGDRRSTHTGFCAVLGKPIRLFALTFAPRKKMKLPSGERQAALGAEPAASFPSFRSSTVSSSWLWTTPVPPFFFSLSLSPSVTRRIRSGRRTPVTNLQLSKVLCRLFLTKHLGLSVARVLYLTWNSLARKDKPKLLLIFFFSTL